MLKFNQAEQLNPVFLKSLYEEIRLNGKVIGDMYVHPIAHDKYHACIRLPVEMSLAQGHGDTRLASVTNALQVACVKLREFTDQFAVLSAQINKCIEMEPTPFVAVPPDFDLNGIQ